MKKTYAPSVSLDEAMGKLLKKRPDVANEYLRLALEEADTKEGQELLLLAIKRIAEAQGLQKIAEKAGIARQSLYRALSPAGNPRLDTLLAIIKAIGAKMTLEEPSGAKQHKAESVRKKVHRAEIPAYA